MALMVMSPAGIKALEKYEGLELEAYLDSAGVWTVGFGHTGSKYAQPGVKITKQKARELLKLDIKRFENVVNKYVKVPLSQEQLDALCSLSFNIGEGAFARSTLLKKLNAGDYLGAADEMLRWTKATVNGKKVSLPGLVKRRADERAMFLSGTDIQVTEDKFESNIEPDAPKASVSLKEPSVVATGGVVALGGLNEAVESLEPFAGYSETIRYVWVVLGVIAVLTVLYKSRKD